MDSLLVVGSGEIGRRVGLIWKKQFPNALVTAQTRSPEKHESLKALGFQTEIWSASPSHTQFSHVLIAVPPSQAALAPELIPVSRGRWTGKGNFVNVSSISVYKENNGAWVDEDSETVTTPEPTLLQEQACLKLGGCIARLAGLYSETRGPQQVYRRKAEVHSNPDSWINLIHDDDAAKFCFLILRKGTPGDIYLGADHSPLTRRDLAKIAAEIPPVQSPCTFTDLSGPLGKRCQAKKSWTTLGFTPRWPSFQKFATSLRSGAPLN
ncbi:MAG: hypothetical protein K2X47_07075 [Bdellovibrionales bacterium]|nr:hypothetical protein [Bdellovibrionales bacterium]